MTLDELKEALLNKDLPNNVKISADAVVVDVETFLRVQFIACDNWKKDIEKCPSYVRLVRFYEVVSKKEEES